MRIRSACAALLACSTLICVAGAHTSAFSLPEKKAVNPQPAKFKNALGMEFVLVPKGKSWLGGGGGKAGEKEVEMPNDFYLGTYAVTQEEWQKITGKNPSYYRFGGYGEKDLTGVTEEDLKRFPVESISWDDVQQFLKLLNEKMKEAGWVYRLPTAAEREYACRGGPMADKADSAFDFYFQKPTNALLPKQANSGAGKLKRPCKVGSYTPNRLGLHDIHGNVWEWCEDRVDQNFRPYRGGAFTRLPPQCTAAFQGTLVPSTSGNDIGFRLARVPFRKKEM